MFCHQISHFSPCDNLEFHYSMLSRFSPSNSVHFTLHYPLFSPFNILPFHRLISLNSLTNALYSAIKFLIICRQFLYFSPLKFLCFTPTISLHFFLPYPRNFHQISNISPYIILEIHYLILFYFAVQYPWSRPKLNLNPKPKSRPEAKGAKNKRSDCFKATETQAPMLDMTAITEQAAPYS